MILLKVALIERSNHWRMNRIVMESRFSVTHVLASGVSKGGPGGAMAPPEIFLAPSLAPPLFKRCFVNFYHLLRKGFCQVSEFDGLTFSQDLNVSLLPATEIVIILYY